MVTYLGLLIIWVFHHCGRYYLSFSMTQSLKFLKLDPKAKLPTRGSHHAAGIDLCSIEELVLQPGERAAVKTGLATAIPQGYYGRVAPRSGLAVKNGLDVLAGVIDSDYRGEIRCALINLGNEPLAITEGMRIAQLIVEAILVLEPAWETDLGDTQRGAGGFGSTGTN
jgi:dUTP pyrophosphatase